MPCTSSSIPASRAGLRAAIVAIFALATVAAPLARAEQPHAGSRPVVPPRAVAAGSVPYPPTGGGDATVILELQISTEGRVTEVDLVSGLEPFASAALQAAWGWMFEPAHRGATPVAARVRMRVEFTAPPPSSASGETPRPVRGTDASETARPAPSSPPAAAAAMSPRVDEVHVGGVRGEATSVGMRGGEVRQIPGAFGDAFRAVDALPGVTPIASGLPFFFVRGAPPGNTGYYLDGARVPLLYHLAFGPSVVHPALVDRVDFFPGAFPARFGRYTGGILSAETRPPAQHVHGEANLRLFDAGALVEAPLEDGRGSLLAAGRYSYTAAALSLFAPDTQLAYWDYQSRATWDITPVDRLAVFAFGSFDSLKQRDETGSFQQVAGTEFHRADLRYERKLGASGLVRVAATLGYDRTGDDTGDIRDLSFGVRMAVEKDVANDLRLRGGADVVVDRYDSLPHPEHPTTDVTTTAERPLRDDLATGAWFDVVARPSPRVEIVPGIRVDLFESRSRGDPGGSAFGETGTHAIPALDPRLMTRVDLGGVALISGIGLSHQPPSLLVPLPGASLGNLDNGLQTAVHVSQGAEVSLPADFTATATLFLHRYFSLSDTTATCPDLNESNLGTSSCMDERVDGETYGAEIFVRRSLTRRVTGWLSYTLSRSVRRSHVFGSSDALQTVPSELDRTHVLSAIGAYDLGRGWRAGARFYAYSGRPYSMKWNGVPLPPFNDHRAPPFWRIDFRVEKRWPWQKSGFISLVLEVMNAALQREVIGEKCGSPGVPTPVGQTDPCTPSVIGPVTVPSLGVEAAF